MIRDFTLQFGQIFTSITEKDLDGTLEGIPVTTTLAAVLIKLLNHEIYKKNVYIYL